MTAASTAAATAPAACPGATAPDAGVSMGPCRVIVFAKAPVAGLAKTRLAPALGAHGAAALAARMLRHTLQQACAAGIGPVELCGAPDARHPAFDAALDGLDVARSAQGEGDLGSRMQRALARALVAGDRALLIGTDAPALDAPRLRRAAAALATHEAVFVPTLDGGYVLIGLRRRRPTNPPPNLPPDTPPLFDAMPWSTPAVMARTRERLRDAGCSHHELEPLADIDEPADLQHLGPLRCDEPVDAAPGHSTPS